MTTTPTPSIGEHLDAPLSDRDRALVTEHLKAEQTRLLYRFSLVGYLAELMVTFLLGALLWDELGVRASLFVWFAIALALMIGRYVLYKVFIRRHALANELPRWQRYFMVGSMAMALLWGVMGSFLLPKTGPTQLPVMMLVALLTTGAVAYYAPHRSLFGAAALLSLLPMGIMTMGFGDRNGSLLGAAILILSGLLVIVHAKVHRALVDALSARLDNVLIAKRLEEERLHVERVNLALQQESSDRQKAEKAEGMALQKLKMHVERTPMGVVEWDMEFRATTWNPAAATIFGYSADQMLGHSGYTLVSGQQENQRMASMWMELLQSKGASRVAIANQTRRGAVIHTEWYNTPLIDADDKLIGVATLVQDVTERLNTERTIHYMAHHDALTGLPNRRLMQDRLNQAILQARRQQRHVALMFIDLDRFKLVNDTLGHETGDYVLRDIAKRLTKAVREGDTVSREGGDEFVIILPDLEKPEAAQVVANKILAELVRPIEVTGHDLTVTASIGISHYPNDATDVQHLLKHADSAMYQAKEAGRNTARFFTNDLNFLLTKRLEIESRLRRGIEREEFYLVYQPQVEITTNRIIGVEALLRWRDPVHGEVFPKDFISVAEELGLIVPLGEWVFRAACLQLKQWESEGLRDVTVSINISPRQFVSRKLLPFMKSTLMETGVDATRLDLEITETMAMRNLEQTIEILTEMRRLGATVSIDDFGVGYSSLGQLKRLPAQTLKIDGSFISQIPEDANSCSITEAIIAMGKRLKLRLVAEGVEQQAQLDFLKENGCDAFQGYLFAKPLPVGEMTAMLRAQRG